ncbi:hypothetical protein C8J56DRAFT_900372 [Mycena floridula]|nr:hypothetical protein C8J56DRAFT_900372 [Mycena floridula]
MSAAREDSIASSHQASPHAEVPPVSQEPLNPEIAVLPVASLSPVASSSPDATEPVAEPDELEGDEETPAKAKKGGKPSPSPVFQHLGRLLTKLNQSLVHVQSRLYRRLFLHQHLYLQFVAIRTFASIPSVNQMSHLQLGADDLNYWGYVIDVMYHQLSEVTNPIQQVVIITTIAAMFMSARLAPVFSIVLINHSFSNSKMTLLSPTPVKRWTSLRPAISFNCAGSRTPTFPNPVSL